MTMNINIQPSYKGKVPWPKTSQQEKNNPIQLDYGLVDVFVSLTFSQVFYSVWCKHIVLLKTYIVSSLSCIAWFVVLTILLNSIDTILAWIYYDLLYIFSAVFLGVLFSTCFGKNIYLKANINAPQKPRQYCLAVILCMAVSCFLLMSLMPGAKSLALSSKSDTGSVLGSVPAVAGILMYLACNRSGTTTACQ